MRHLAAFCCVLALASSCGEMEHQQHKPAPLPVPAPVEPAPVKPTPAPPAPAPWIWNTPPVGPIINGEQLNGPVIDQEGAQWASISTPDPTLKVFNNTWGLGGRGQASIFSETVNNQTTYGWSWNVWAYGGVATYQEIGWGWSPNSSSWFAAPTPLNKIGDNKTYTVDFDLLRTDRSGIWDTAFDIWLYPQTNPSGGSGGWKGGYELMVWLDHQQQGPWGSNPQAVNINGTNWLVYDNDGSAGWRVVSYINQDAPINNARGFNLTNFFNDAVQRYGGNSGAGYPGISVNHYVNAIEFGNESCGGNGQLEVANYAVHVK